MNHIEYKCMWLKLMLSHQNVQKVLEYVNVHDNYNELSALVSMKPRIPTANTTA